MKIFIIICLLFASCTANKSLVIEDKIISEESIVSETEILPESDVSPGWLDLNTYTVKVLSQDLDTAIEAARHQILQDIVRVRMLNDSRFTDISKISQEFDKPLRDGRIVSQKSVNGGIEIYYQITDEGLKKKFEKQ